MKGAIANVWFTVCLTTVGTFAADDVVRIAYTSLQGNDQEIFTMRPDGSDKTQLTLNDQHDFDPSISPDGSKIAFASAVAGVANIHVMDLDGSNIMRITFNAQPDVNPAWSPDGRRIVFVGGDGGPYWAVFTVNADGSDRTFLTGGDALYVNPAFSPEGTEIVFASDRVSGNAATDIFIMNADGTDIRQLTSGPPGGRDSKMPVFSPEGSRIVFASEREPLFDSLADIWVMDRDGANFQRLTSEWRNQLWPYWSPDGTQIAYASEETGYAEIFIMNADGGGKLRLTDSHRADEQPAFGPAYMTVNPDEFAVTRGVLVSGGLTELGESDDQRMVIQERPPFSLLDPSIRLEMSGTAPTDTIVRVGFVLETSASFNNIPQVVRLYDFTGGGWEVVDQRFTTLPDEAIEFTELTEAARFVEPGTRRVQARLDWLNPGNTLFPGWVVRIDQFVWQINP